MAWRMLYVGLLYDPHKEHTVEVTDFDFEMVAARLRSYAVVFGLNAAAVHVAIADGGNGRERVLRQNVSDALQFVLDYGHEAERLHKLAGLLHAGDSRVAAAWAERAPEHPVGARGRGVAAAPAGHRAGGGGR